MADASPNSSKDLEIVETVDDPKEMGNGDEGGEGKTTGESIKDDDKEEIVIIDPDNNEINDPSSSNDDNHKPEKSANEDSTSKSDTSAMDSRSIRSRVFVGHLNTDRASRRDLDKLFSSCGKVVAISLLSGYGFIQFDNEESARKAIDEVHGTPFFGMKLVVDKPAAWKKLDGENPKEPKPWPKDPKRPFVPDHSDERRRRERRRERNRREQDDRYSYYDDIPPRYHDPYYERYLEMRYMEERLAERYRADYDRYYDRYPPPATGRYPADYHQRMDHDYRFDYRSDYRERSRYGDARGYEPSLLSRYDRPRDDDYDRRRPFDNYYH